MVWLRQPSLEGVCSEFYRQVSWLAADMITAFPVLLSITSGELSPKYCLQLRGSYRITRYSLFIFLSKDTRKSVRNIETNSGIARKISIRETNFMKMSLTVV